MKILVVDNADQIAACLVAVDAEIACHIDEIQALNVAEQFQPDLILLNYAVQGTKSAEYVRLLLDAAPQANVVVLAEIIAEEVLIRCVLSGAKGFQELKQFPQYCDRLVRAISEGEAWLSRKLVAKLIDSVRLLPA